MNKVLLGKYVNTHGIKGEIRMSKPITKATPMKTNKVARYFTKSYL